MSVEFSVSKVDLINLCNNETVKDTYYLQNRCSTSRKVRVALSKNSHPDFSLLSSTDERYLAAGLKLPVVLQYSPTASGTHYGQIEVYVNEKLNITLPIKAAPPSAIFEVSSTLVSFGSLVCEHQLCSRLFKVNNTGTKEGGFSLETSLLPSHFTVSPKEGVLQPNQSVDVVVEMVCKQKGSFKEKVIVIPHDEPNSVIAITLEGNLTNRQLQLIDLGSTFNLQRISFGDTYYETVVTRKVLLFNNSPVVSHYIALLDDSVQENEGGVDMSEGLAMACTSGGLRQTKWKEQGDAPSAERIISIFPSEGSLGPYEKCLVELFFSPRFIMSEAGWTHHQGEPLQRDYALFVKFMHIGALQVETVSPKLGDTHHLEVALTGTAHPVQFVVQPAKIVNFGSCSTGSVSTQDIQLINESIVLPIEYQCRQLAHYKFHPNFGKILPGEIVTMTITFNPKQLGRLNFKLYIDLIGMQATSDGKIKNEVVYTTIIDLRGNGEISVAGKKERKVKLAHPNDISTSVRPHDTKTAGVIMDPDDQEEITTQSQQKSFYASYIKDRRVERLWREKEKTDSNPVYRTAVDMTIPPAQGLASPTICTSELTKNKLKETVKGGYRQGPSIDSTLPIIGQQIKTTTAVSKSLASKLDFVEKCPSKPSSNEMSSQCRKHLSPTELNKIIIDPEVIDFGSVVVNCIAELQVHIKNITANFVKLIIKLTESGITCPIYKNQSSFQFFLPPCTYTQLPFTICINQVGIFERSIEYSINGHHQRHIPVKVDVSELSLNLSTNSLVLTEPPLAIQSAGLRGSVVVKNPHSIPVFFQWLAKEGVETNIFNTMHPTGYVPAEGSLECEFVCQPSYQSPSSAQFFLDDSGTSSLSTDTNHTMSNVLSLIAKFKRPTCKIRESRLLFGTIPLNITTTRIIHIDNTGDCHAYYKVVDSSPHPSVRVFPEIGSVAIGGAANLKILCCPGAVGVFDICVYVSLREGKTLSFRLAGIAEQPTVSIDQELFRFGSVFCGAHASQPFTVSNKGSTNAVLTFDLSCLSDFSLKLPRHDDFYGEQAEITQPGHHGVYTLSLAGNSSAVCKLDFCPKKVAAYDFLLSIRVNGLEAPTPPPSPWPPSRTASYIVVMPSDGKGTIPSFSLTPIRRVLATALRSPLQIPNTQFNFQLPVDFLDATQQSLLQHDKEITLINVSGDTLTWAFHDSETSDSQKLKDGTFQFALPSGKPFAPPIIPTNTPLTQSKQVPSSQLKPGETFSFLILFKPAHHGLFNVTIPLIVNGDITHPYQTIELTASLPPCQISVSPSCIHVLPVPLGVSLTAQFTITVQGFILPVELDVEIPPMKEGVSFSVDFPAGSKVKDCSQLAVEIPCSIDFRSNQSVLISDYITFADKISGKKKHLPFTVCADNSLFSVYKFLAQNIHIASISLGDNQTPTLVLQSPSTNRSGSVASDNLSGSVCDDTTLSLNPSATFSDMFQQDCVTAICQWLSAYGWAGGIKCITTPSDLRVRVGDGLPKPGVKQRSSITTSRGLIVDMLTHLCGRVPPGIPLNLPPCTTTSEMVNQQYSTYRTVTSFLKSQGGLLWSVVPEALLDYHDYCYWLEDVEGKESIGFSPEDEVEFNDLSNQAWTHLLMQIVKVLVLPRATSCIPKSLKGVVSEILTTKESNVYSKSEQILLAWLNHHYTKMKTRVFETKELSLSEVVNFDVDLMDCTVFACVLASYCPFLIQSHLLNLFTEPDSPEECTHNAIVLIRALRYVGIDYDIQTNDLSSPNPISLMLLTAFLCQRLPTFKPKGAPIVFEGILGSTPKQQIQLSNPSSKMLEYRILILGENSQEFMVQAENSTVILKGKQDAELTLTYHAKCLSSTEATLLLVSRGGKLTIGSTLAFQLTGNITTFKPHVSTSVTASQYNCESLSIDVSSPFKTRGNFELRICEINEKTLLQLVPVKARKRFVSDLYSLVPASALQQKSTDQVHLFKSCLPSTESGTQMVCLEPGESKSIPMKFVALKHESRRSFIVMSNKDLGDLILSVSAVVKHPQPMLPHSNCLSSFTVINPQTKTLHLKVHAGQFVQEEIVINSNNVAFSNAILEISKWEMSEAELRRRQLTESLQYAALTTAISTLRLGNRVKMYEDGRSGDSDVLYFSVHGSDTEHFSLPDKIAVPAKNNGTAVLLVSFFSDEEGQYECHIVLRSNYDVRVLVIETTVLARGRHAHLQFNAHALQSITQDIPLVNPSTADWPLVVSLSGGGFSGPEFLIARALTTTCYPLTFNPHTKGQVKGVLHLLNNSDGSEHEFQLTGVADRPLAQDHITLHTQAKKRMSHILHIPNHNERTCVFRVESDLEFISGPSNVTVGGGDVVDYHLDVLSKRQGRFSGAIAFVTEAVSRPHSFKESLEATESFPEKSPYHVWFRIDCVVDPAPPDRVIPISCHNLSSVMVQLNIANSCAEKLVLQALLEGHGISGPATLEIEPSGEACYPLSFAPTLFGKSDGRIVFNGHPEGEFWYELALNAENPETVSLPLVKTELGRATLQTVTLANPLDEPVTIICDNSNTKHFTISGLLEGKITIASHSSSIVSVLFNPSALGTADQTTDLSFINEKIGKQTFVLQGEGIAPTSMDPITICATRSSNTVHIIKFSNPFDLPTYFSVQIQGKHLDHFCLLMKRSSSILLHPGVSLDIPIMFAPESVQEHNITAIVSAELGRSQETLPEETREPLCWKYPIIGLSEVRPFTPSSAPKFSCRAKERIERILEVSLAGSSSSTCSIVFSDKTSTNTAPLSEPVRSPQSEAEGCQYSFKLTSIDKKLDGLVSQCIGIKIVGQSEKKKDGEKSVCLEFGIIFAPPKAFSSMCELKVTCSKGGVWLFPLHFSASAPAPDDTIIVQSKGLNEESQIGFRLTSMTEHPTPFTAHFASSSDADFTVFPMSGSLAPVNTKGTLFCITYKPTIYGRIHRGTLIIQSGTNEWRYNIVGKIPANSRPSNAQVRIQNRLNSPIRLVNAAKKNFVSDNIHAV